MFLTAIIVALIIVNQVVRKQVFESVSTDMEKSRMVFKEIQKRDWQLLRERSWVAAEAPHLKAAVDTEDSTTVQGVAAEIIKTVSSDIMIVLDKTGKVLARHGLSEEQIRIYHQDSLSVYDQTPEGEIARLSLSGNIFHVVRSPVVAFSSGQGATLLGYLILGNKVDESYIQQLKHLVKSEIAFLKQDKILFSTFPAALKFAPQIAYWDTLSTVRKVSYNHEEYLVERAGLNNHFLLLQSVDKAFQSVIRPIEKTMLAVGVFAIVVAFLISGFISREIVTPVKTLVKATDAITAGEYNHPIKINSRDEIGQLATKFDDMRHTLQQKMSQLEQQNIELETAMKQLASTQQELLQTEKLAATGKITAQLSHELNNPLHNIRACLEAAQKKIDEAHDSREFIDMAYEEVQRIGKLVRQMLDFYRPQQIRKQKVQVAKLVTEVIKASEKNLVKDNIVVSNHVNSPEDEIYTAPDQLKQVLLNLTLNSIDAMPEGGTIHWSTFTDDKFFSIMFEDSGHGIPEENINKIFDAFFTTKSKASGVGLGLSVSYGIIRSLGGNIFVESNVNQGTKFTIQLPLNEKEKVV